MDSRLRPYATAGIALVGASVIAITPVAPPTSDIQIANPAVQLSAAVDPITPWVDVVNESSANATELSQVGFEAPAPVLQQVLVNQFGYLNEVLNNPGSIGPVLTQVSNNLKALFETATFLGPMFDLNDPDDFALMTQSNDIIHAALTGMIVGFLPPSLDDQTKALIGRLIQVMASPAAGVLIGLAGPFISPVVAALNSVMAITGAPDFETALQELVAMPANVVGSFFNGATLNLDVLVPLIAAAGIMPEGISITHVEMAFGGLLSPGGTGGEFDGTPGGVITDGIGGSIWNSLGLTVDIGVFALAVKGQPVGPLGALTSLSQMLAKSIGWDGTGNPLTNVTFPTINPSISALSSGVPANDPAVAPKTLFNEKASAPAATSINLDAVTTPAVDKGSEVSLKSAEAPSDGEKTTKPKLRVNPLKQVGKNLRDAGDRAERNLSDLGKKLTPKIKSPKKSAVKSPTADKPSDGHSAGSSDAA